MLIAGALLVADRPRIEGDLRSTGLSLVELRSSSLTQMFPSGGKQIYYVGRAGYVMSVISPDGKWMYGVRRQHDLHSSSIAIDTLVRRGFTPSGPGEEEVLDSPFVNIVDLGVSRKGTMMLIVGRPQSAGRGSGDGIFLYNRGSHDLSFIEGLSLSDNEVSALNVNEDGSMLLYQEGKFVKTVIRSNGRVTFSGSHAGRFPVLMPDGQSYIYENSGKIILRRRSESRTLIAQERVVGGIRLSPDARFIAFGIDLYGNLGDTQLSICDVATPLCVRGPVYVDRIAGRATYWAMF